MRTKERQRKDKGKYILERARRPPRSPALGPPVRPYPRPPWLAISAEARLPTLILSKNSTTTPTASSLDSHLSAGALGCSHPQSFPTLCHNALICGAHALHSTKRWYRDCLLPQLHHQHLPDSNRCGPVIRSCKKEPIVGWPESS